MQGSMDRGEAIARLKQHEAEFRQLGVEHLPGWFNYLFGFYELMDVKEAAARILGYPLMS
jgi:hypothetical protein